MISLEEARLRMLDGVRPVQTEIVSLAEAWGRVTAAPVLARVAHPPRDVSAMDGYAVAASGAGVGAVLRVVGAAPAGHPWDGPALRPGEAVRIFTGGVLPQGGDAVLIQEDARREGDTVTVIEAPVAGRYIRRAGQDFAVGEVLVAAGRRITARDVGLAGAGNHPWIAVHRRPRVGILSTGDEVALPGEAIPPGGVVSSNTHALAALVRGAGGEPVVFPSVPDDRDSLARAAEAAAGLDLLLTSGGASVGDHDLVRETLQGSGMALDFWNVAMRPGKPLLHGSLRGVKVVGLPGNPVSVIVAGVMMVRPVIERLSGLPGDPPEAVPARLGAAVPENDRRADHLRARLERDADGMLVATPFPRQDSGMMRFAAMADALVLRAPYAPSLPAGSTVAVIRLDRHGV
jgi:molybdopterin molybdotransferase